jgi:NADH-quinone oxidoreductase subunit K
VTAIPMADGLILGGVLFALGLAGVLLRRNLLLILVSIEIMLNGAGVTFVAAGSRWGQADGQVMVLFILAAAAAEVSVGLSLLLTYYHRRQTLDADSVDEMRG